MMNKLNMLFIIFMLIGMSFVVLPFIQDKHGIQPVVLSASGWFDVCASTVGYALNGGNNYGK